ncbi:hypothetical protein BU096_11450 [Staphylococcus xylosus]|uniref:hypothetical protein n=1 Tax=Staphylococcus xylosus TaxID=1288 RepID=UPI000D1DDF3C|nr:hypothetical protein [Staphylococcus xylosus]PTI04590.1 hypothetical protein BU096_11450 [Staphylococcus xylosus]
MSEKEYKIKTENLTNHSEETSAISAVSYEVENANSSGLKLNKIKGQINKLKEYDEFPSNLEYVDSYTDPHTGTTSAAFLNKDTGKVTVGMTGTNVHKHQLKNTLNPFNFVKNKQDIIDARGTIQDFGADANNKSSIAAKKQASNKLKQIDADKASMIQASGGALSSLFNLKNDS